MTIYASRALSRFVFVVALAQACTLFKGFSLVITQISHCRVSQSVISTTWIRRASKIQVLMPL